MSYKVSPTSFAVTYKTALMVCYLCSSRKKVLDLEQSQQNRLKDMKKVLSMILQKLLMVSSSCLIYDVLFCYVF